MDISLSAVDKSVNMSNETDINDLWEKLIPALEKSLNKPIYETLISSTKPMALSDSLLTIAVPNELVKDWLSKHCITLMEQESRAICDREIKVEFMVGSPDLFTTPALDEKKLRICLHLHEYHSEVRQKQFWSQVTAIPLNQFFKVYKKPHTGKRKKENYPGCVSVRYYDVDVAFALNALWRLFGQSHGRVG